MAVTNPYPGLRPYDVSEFEAFFARDREIDELLVRLLEHRFVAVVGLSGSGKSSLVRAGLIHRLQVGGLAIAGRKWKVALFRPGSAPLAMLASALDGELGHVPDRAADLRDNTQQLLRTTREGRQPDENLLIVVDQFEEIFRALRMGELSARDAAHFVDLLMAVEQDLSPTHRVYVVLTMRSDALGESSQFEGLPEALNRCQYLVPRMNREQLREAIEGPAALTETALEPALVHELLVEAGEGADQLPLLQHALMQLWEGRQQAADGDYLMTRAQLKGLGGPAQALNDHANRVLGRLLPDQQALARDVFQQITEVSSGREQRRPTRIRQLAAIVNASEDEIRRVIRPFFDANFLTSPDRDMSRGRHVNETTDDWEIDIPHEVLIRQWDTLREWARQETDDRSDFEYFSARQRRGGLLIGVDLDEALLWRNRRVRTEAWARRYAGALAPVLSYIDESSATRERELAAVAAEREAAAREQVDRERKKRRTAAIVATVGAVLILLLGGSALYGLRQRNVVLQSENALATESARAAAAERERELQTSRAETAERDRELQVAQAASREQEASQLQALADQRLQLTAEQAESERAISRWQALASEARNALQGRISDRGALLARQAYLLYQQSPDAARRRFVDDALVNALGSRVLSSAFPAHRDIVYAEAFSPDGAHLISGSADNSVAIWNLRDGSQVPARLLYHPDNVNDVAWSPNGERFASAGDDDVIRVWDASGLAADLAARRDPPITLFRGHTDDVRSIAFSPDGTRLVSGSDDNTVRVWDLQRPDAEPVRLPPVGDDVEAVAFSPDGMRVAAGAADDLVRVWDLRRPEVPVVLRGHSGDVNGLAFSPTDPLLLASGSDDDTIRLWNLRDASGPPVVLEGHQGDVYSVAFSPDGGRLASGSWDDTVRVWDMMRRDRVPLVLDGHALDVNGVAFSPDGRRLASGSDDRVLRIWVLPPADAQRSVFIGHTNWVQSVAFLPDGNYVVSGSRDNTVRVWDIRASTSSVLKGHTDAVNAVAVSRDGTRVASASDDRTVRIWDWRRPGANPVVLNQGAAIRAVMFLQDGTVVTGNNDGAVSLWDVRQPAEPRWARDEHTDEVYGIAVSPDGRRLASASLDRTIRLWDLGQPQAEPRVLETNDRMISVAFSPDGTYLAAGSENRLVRVWNVLRLDQPPVVWSGHDDFVMSLAFSPDGSQLASASWDDTIRVWDYRRAFTEQGAAMVPVVFRGHRSDANAVAFSPDGTRFVSASDDRTVRVVDLWSRAADAVCGVVPRNLTADEWRTYVGTIEYQRTCTNLPVPAATR